MVSFRYYDPCDNAVIVEEKFCKNNKIKLIRIAMDADLPTDKQLKLFLDTVNNPANQPVLVHCEYGRSRTGVMVAAYRIKSSGWSAEKAIEESHEFKINMRLVYEDYLREIAD